MPALERQAERALVLASGDDVVCVPREIDPEYLGFLSSLGLGPSAANVIAVPALHGEGGTLAERLLRAGGMVEQLAGRLGTAEVTLYPYAGRADAFALANALELVRGRPVRVYAGSVDATAKADTKHLMRERAEALGVPVAPGEVATLPHRGRRKGDLEPLRAAIERQLRRADRVVVRGTSSTGGSMRFLVEPGGDDTDEVLRRVGLGADERVYLVEALVDATARATVHALVEPESRRVRIAGVSDRRLGRGLAPAGCRFPTAARAVAAMECWAGRLAESLAAEGYAGRVGFDFVECRGDAGEPRVFLTGVAPRASEATYAMALGERLRAPALVSGLVPVRAASFGRLRELLGRLLYDPDRGSGIVPYGTGWLDQGRCPIVALGGDRTQASELLGKAQAAMAAKTVDISGGRPVS
ncbi:MAG TPA: hypothetical protein VEB59_01800 [Gemmatimonadales bacterium]|nr:hypothetical protein [Gemmatimonadales bacterium]